jgi:signal transduction histidine kinase
MRRLLGVVRREPELAPQPGMGTLPVLVDQVRAAGTPVWLRIDGDPVPLPSGVDLSAYRIVQEALTNTLKHAGTGAAATVLLTFREDRLEIEVGDDGMGAPAAGTRDGAGSGLAGIAERVAMLGGSLRTGPGDAGGFVVRAALPLGEAPAGTVTPPLAGAPA